MVGGDKREDKRLLYVCREAQTSTGEEGLGRVAAPPQPLHRYTALLQAGSVFQEEVEEMRWLMKGMAEAQSRSIIFRCMEREVDEGETCSCYFFKKNYGAGGCGGAPLAEDPEAGPSTRKQGVGPVVKGAETEEPAALRSTGEMSRPRSQRGNITQQEDHPFLELQREWGVVRRSIGHVNTRLCHMQVLLRPLARIADNL
ncbi:hypothetical protein SKAU_G00386830 [Synaphobranchus kaupii]|uniref:Uncharacterized protein n=1 Tax=Synaphobranchus kaupii TaxID=118154 RepID=A0A9Q1ID82_SYNKA|nr:hypothetical protein SKAU_G00386830 [Synaphobranchus kaupii]